MTNTKLPKILVIVGPTTSHKTHLAVEIANKFDGEIINADAYQVYKDMSIGTNAPTKQELESAVFHLNQVISLTDEWDIKKFQTKCLTVIKDILSRGKLPILVGGSNLYVDAIIKNYDLSSTKRNEAYDQYDNQKLYELLFAQNPELAKKIGVNNKRRLTRALEIINETKDPNALVKTNEPIFDYLMIECNYPTRAELYDSINNKVGQMINSGWKQEVLDIMKKYPNLDLLHNVGFKAIGYSDFYLSIINNTPVNEELIKQKVRRYAKRQITWINNKYPEHLLFDQSNKAEVFKQIELWKAK